MSEKPQSALVIDEAAGPRSHAGYEPPNSGEASRPYAQRRTWFPRFETLRLFSGAYFWILGMSVLLLPEGALGIRLQPTWLSGSALLATGLGVLWLSILSLPRRSTFILWLVCALPPLVIAISNLRAGMVTSAMTLVFFTIGIILAPFAPDSEPHEAYRPDALGLLLGAIVAIQGLEILAGPQATESSLEALGLQSQPLGWLLTLSGNMVIATQLIARTPSLVRHLAHITCGLVILGLHLVIMSLLEPLYWLLGISTAVRAVVTMILPWWSERARGSDIHSFRPRAALALMTAAIIPVGVALPVLLTTIPTQSPALTLARQVAFGTTWLVLLIAGVGGWLLAGTLAGPLTRLMHDVNRIAGGQDDVQLPQAGVTEVVVLSRAVEQMANALEARTAERTLLLEQERQARAEAQEAVRVRDAFFSVAAHELRNPLTALISNVQLLERRLRRDAALNERDQRTLRMITEQARRVNTMVVELLDVSRLEHGQLQIAPAQIDLGELIQRAIDEQQPILARHAVQWQPPRAPVQIYADELRMMQVLENLLSNAAKYSPEQSPIRVELRQNARTVSVSVADEGIGIPRDAVPRLFQRFYRADNASNGKYSGIGVGLYVIKEIVTLHGGHVEVASSEGRGSTFTVHLPLWQAASPSQG